jgi:putative oxidoreductase
MQNRISLVQWSYLPLRVVMGTGFIVHGWSKWSRGAAAFGKLLQFLGVPSPDLTAWIVTLLELIGGIALIIGAFVTIISIPLVISMLVAMFTVNVRYGFSATKTLGLNESGPIFGPPGYEINLLYIAGLFILMLAGAGPFSVDRWLQRRNRISDA